MFTRARVRVCVGGRGCVWVGNEKEREIDIQTAWTEEAILYSDCGESSGNQYYISEDVILIYGC